MNVFLLIDNWADCGCGVPYTEAVFSGPGQAILYVDAKERQEYDESKLRYIKHHGTSKVNGQDYPRYESFNWVRDEDRNNLASWQAGRWTIQEVVVQ